MSIETHLVGGKILSSSDLEEMRELAITLFELILSELK